MAGPRQAAAVVIGRGRKHMSGAEKEARLEADALARNAAGKCTAVHAPKWLPKELRPDFKELRDQLTELSLISKMDRDILGFFLVARSEYAAAGRRASAAIAAGDDEGAQSWSNVQDKYFKQARGCANDLGLSVSSRCRLILPSKEDSQEDEFTRFLQTRRNGTER